MSLLLSFSFLPAVPSVGAAAGSQQSGGWSTAAPGAAHSSHKTRRPAGFSPHPSDKVLFPASHHATDQIKQFIWHRLNCKQKFPWNKAWLHKRNECTYESRLHLTTKQGKKKHISDSPSLVLSIQRHRGSLMHCTFLLERDVSTIPAVFFTCKEFG